MPELRVLAGNPTAAEVAAVTVVLLATSGTGAAAGSRPAPPPVSRWRTSARPTPPGRPVGWRASTLPRA